MQDKQGAALMTQEEAANLLNVPVPRLKRWRWHGTGPAYIHMEKEVRYHPDDVQAYIAEKRRIPALQAASEIRHVTAVKKR